MVKRIVIHSDGACEGNPGPGGWGAVLAYGGHRKEISGGVPATTNNRMELRAAVEALKALRERCIVDFYTDSVYVQTGITKSVPFWRRSNWRTVSKSPVKNKELWIELDKLASGHEISWHWLKGHAGHIENEQCDFLARSAIAQIRKQYSKADLAERLKEFKEAQRCASDAGREKSPTLFE